VKVNIVCEPTQIPVWI